MENQRLGRPAFLAVSFLSLFLEVLLIRWCGSEIRILAYLKNLTLLGCFLGLGLGYAAASRKRLSLAWTFVATAVIVAFAHPWLIQNDYPSFRSLSTLLDFSDVHAWKTGTKGIFVLGLSLLLVLYALLAFAFVPMGQLLGAHFKAVPAEERVREYTWNVVASLAGVAAFGALSFLEAPPLAWFALGALAAVVAFPRPAVIASAAVAGAILAHAESMPPRIGEGDVARMRMVEERVLETKWSPYQKTQLVEEKYAFDRPPGVEGPPRLEWTDWSNYVNGHWYSRAGTANLEVARQRGVYARNDAPFVTQLTLTVPYLLGKGRGRALLLGAGLGRDAAMARAQGVGDVDCVEIERLFIDWGTRLHPDKPYLDAKVHVHVDDARRFLRGSAPGTYDLVVFCYLDAHALTSNFTNTNLDSYVYTKESLAEAKRTLAPGGVLALGFWSPNDFIYRRLETALEDVFGSPPLRLGGDGSLFVNGLEGREVLRERARAAGLAVVPSSRVPGKDVPVTTDDWPFFYLESASVPTIFRAVLAAIAVLSAVGVFAVFGSGRGSEAGRLGIVSLAAIDPHFLLLGAAFMLVETWAISRASLVYGATWYVSSAVIASLLVAVLAANARVERKGAASLRVAFPCLLAGLVVATLVDPSRLLDLPRAAQLALAAPLYALPFLFASTIFASSFSKVEKPEEALASNLLGSVLGGALECLAFATGLRSLGFVAIGLYACAWLVAKRK